jgi:GMP synthase (glutamine-hydrolysing)
LRILIAESEPQAAREKRRASVGRSSGETYMEVLREVAPGAVLDRVRPTDVDAALPDTSELAGYDAVVLSGSPLHLYEPSDEAERLLVFMRAVFRSGTPSFGSCAGLQVATVAAGGKVRKADAGHEAGFARRLSPTSAGRRHPLLDGRPPAYDAPAIHSDEVDTLPAGATLLASNPVTQVQAAEIRCEGGVFWGVQYHPEISLAEVAAALRREAGDLVESGLAGTHENLEAHAALIDALDQEPNRRDLAWRLGLNEEVTCPRRRRTELWNFIRHLAEPTATARGRFRS